MHGLEGLSENYQVKEMLSHSVEPSQRKRHGALFTYELLRRPLAQPLKWAFYYCAAGLVWHYITDTMFNMLHWTSVYGNLAVYSLFLISSGGVLRLIGKQFQSTEKSYQRLLEVAPNAIFVYREEKLVYANAAAVALFGINGSDDILNRPIWDVIGTSNFEFIRQKMCSSTNTHVVPSQIKGKFNLHNGKVIELEIQIIPCIFQGKPSFEVLVQDVTAWKQAEERLQEAKELFESVFEYSTDSIAVFNLKGYLTKANPSFAELMELDAHDIHLNRGLIDLSPLISPEEADQFRFAFREVVRQRVPFVEYQSTRQKLNGQKVEILARLSPLHDSEIGIVAVSCVVKDITELTQARDVLISSEKLLAVGQLAAGVAHEIRNPLTALQGFLKLLPGANPASQSLYSEIMRAELSRIESIVNEMLALAKPKTIRYEPISLQGKLDETISLLEAEAHMRDVLIETVYCDEVAIVSGDANQLKQVFVNLMKNGIESMANGGKLCVSVHREDNEWVVRFQDEGSGMAKEVLDTIGRPFFTTKSQGTGLGLIVTQRILADHRATLTFESIQGEGTTAILRFACEQDDAALAM